LSLQDLYIARHLLAKRGGDTHDSRSPERKTP
jgi:ornithine cyclodeaminase